MQICSATIRLAGSLNNTVRKGDLTPAEIVVLQALHGQDAVIELLHERDERRSHTFEFERLSALYSPNTNLATPDGERPDIIQRLFPGAVKKLPINLVEIGMGEYANTAITIAAKETDTQKALLEEESEEQEAARLAQELSDLKAEDARREEERKAIAEALAAEEAEKAANAQKQADDDAAFAAKEAAEIAKLNEETEEEQIARMIAEDEAAAKAAAKIKK